MNIVLSRVRKAKILQINFCFLHWPKIIMIYFLRRQFNISSKASKLGKIQNSISRDQKTIFLKKINRVKFGLSVNDALNLTVAYFVCK